jgi:hypothetical protein
MSIKLHEAAVAMNKYVFYKTGVPVPSEMTTWKYYLNISGIYHSIDDPIQIVSLDNQQSILFSKDSWLLHPYTREQYNYGTRRYKDLVQQKPTREPFILNSLFPADITKSIESPNGTILAYDKSLIQENEYTLILEIQDFIYNFTRRWYNPGYAMMHDLYLGTFYVLLHNAVYMKIVTARMARCHTDQAHDFHIKSHLASHHWLDENYNSLTVKQLHWLYRNINYITRNAGQKQTFEWLVENLFDQRDLPLYEYVMKHTLDSKINDVRPIPIMVRNALTSHTDLVAKDVQIKTALKVTNTLAKENLEYSELNSVEIFNKLSDSSADTQKTKILECAVDDLKTANLYSTEETLFSHWVAYAALGQYNAIIEIQAPNSAVSVNINAKDASLIYMYCLLKINYPDIYNSFNSITFNGVYVANQDDISRLRLAIPQKTLSDEKIQKLYSLLPQYRQIASSYDFIDYCTKVRDGYYEQWKMWTSEPGTYDDAALETAALLRQRTVRIDTSNISIDDILSRNYIDISTFTENDYQKLADTLQKSFIGSAEESNVKTRQIQKSMVKIMLKLSSYSIQIADNSTDSIMTYVPTNAVKMITLQHGGANKIELYDQTLTGIETDIHNNCGYSENNLYRQVYVSEKDIKIRLLDNNKYLEHSVIVDPSIMFKSVEQLSQPFDTEYYNTVKDSGTFLIDKKIEVNTYTGKNSLAILVKQNYAASIDQAGSEYKIKSIDDIKFTEIYDDSLSNSNFIESNKEIKSSIQIGKNNTSIYASTDKDNTIGKSINVHSYIEYSKIEKTDILIDKKTTNSDSLINSSYASIQNDISLGTSFVLIDNTPDIYSSADTIATKFVPINNTNHISAIIGYGLAFMTLTPSQRASELDNLIN